LRFVSVAELESEFEERPQIFTPWFLMEWQHLSDQHAKLLSGYAKNVPA
jgi:isopentenyldiphosphate isomerase